MIKAIFFDIDDTIFDFSQCAHRAFGNACAAVRITLTEEAWQTFCRIDVSLWRAQKEGRLTVAEAVRFRAEHFAKAVNVREQASAFQQAFQRALSAQTALVPDADHVLHSLSGRFPLFAASNGTLQMQLSRLKSAGLFLYFSDVFVSDEIGFENPDSRFFSKCLHRIHFRPEEVLMVGDSLQADIAGGAKSGLKTCWLNRTKKLNPTDIIPDYEIRGLSELLTLLINENEERTYGNSCRI